MTMDMTTPNTVAMILASGSAARRRLMQQAGLAFDVVPSTIDESAVRAALLVEDGAVDSEDLAEILARAKAEDVAANRVGTVVVGGDQVLEIDGEILEKPGDVEAVRDQLLRLRGRTHALYSAVAVTSGDDEMWTHVDVARVTLREFSMKALGGYLAASGEQAVGSVGGYQLEGPGLQLIARVEGDYFTVLGLPMLALLDELRRRGVVVA